MDQELRFAHNDSDVYLRSVNQNVIRLLGKKEDRDRYQAYIRCRLYEYEDGRLPFYHFDVYRIGDIEEMEEIGYDDYFFGEGVCLIEWAELIEELIPEGAISITIEKDLEKGFDYRKITVE